jgi:hypothetical protein
MQLCVLFLVLGSSLSLYAELLPASLLPNTGAIVSNDQTAFLGAAAQTNDGVGTWTPSVGVSGATACSYAENANCVTAADLTKWPEAPSLLVEVGQNDIVRNNLPEPSTWLLIVGSVPLLWKRVKRTVQ